MSIGPAQLFVGLVTDQHGVPVRGAGVVLLSLDEGEAAIEHMREAVRLAPEISQAHYSLGNALRMWGETEEAVSHFEVALRLTPDYPEARQELSLARSGEEVARP